MNEEELREHCLAVVEEMNFSIFHERRAKAHSEALAILMYLAGINRGDIWDWALKEAFKPDEVMDDR